MLEYWNIGIMGFGMTQNWLIGIVCVNAGTKNKKDLIL